MDAQAFSRLFVLRWKQSLELPNSVVRDVNHPRKIRLQRNQVKTARSLHFLNALGTTRSTSGN